MAWTTETVNDSYRIAVYTEDLTLPDSGGANEASVKSSAISTPLPINDELLVEVDITEASGGNGSLDLKVLASFTEDGTYFEAISTASQSIDTTSTGKTQFWVDISGKDAPFYKLELFTDGTDILDSADITLKTAFRNPTIYRQ